MCRASSTLVLPAPLSPVSRFNPGPGTRLTCPKRRRPEISSRVMRISGPAKQNARAMPGVRVPRGTNCRSQSKWHHHVPALLTAGLTDQGGGVGVAQLQDDVLVAQGGEGIEQVIDVETDGKAVDAGLGLDFLLG